VNGPNRLAHEKSPYLLQHAGNPVDWHPWGEEAFARARREDKPLFLSVGYSTCHWCHVMAHESFENAAVAALLNEAFVCIKVDREERPDIDGVYMKACQLMTGGGGWPLTIIMTPDLRPFFAATYIPKDNRWGRPGLTELIPRLQGIWKTRREEIEKAAAETLSHLSRDRMEPGDIDAERLLAEAFTELQRQFDGAYGGFGDAPKFPMPHQVVFLLRHWQRTGVPEALVMAERTLHAIRRGGIFDQLGFGCHRYSTDRQWLVPHFEKMLYDQALLAIAFTEAFQATGEDAHARSVREILEYVLRDLRMPEGGFTTAEDADSEGEEGRFYLWRMEEIRRVLDPHDVPVAIAVFSLAEEGNFVDPIHPESRGENILHFSASISEIAEGLGLSEADLLRRMEKMRLQLLAAREGRVRPQRDDKILTDWNGLMIAALARAARVLNEPRYLHAARQAIDFILARLRTADGRLLHRYCKGEAGVAGNLDDYAFFIWGLIESYEAGFDPADLREAIAHQEIVGLHFRDADGGCFATPDDGERLLLRMKEGQDGAIPSGNALTMMNLVRLGRMTGDHRKEEEAERISRAFAGSLTQFPSAHAQWMVALELLVTPSLEVVIAGRPGSEEKAKMLEVIRRRYLPHLSLLFRDEGEGSPEISDMAPFTEGMRSLDGRTTAYLCANFSCRNPVTDPDELADLLDSTANWKGGRG
jgi:uncharacterized protein YyaL (SSP411 family)